MTSRRIKKVNSKKNDSGEEAVIIKKNLKKGISIPYLSIEEIKYLDTHTGKQIYKNATDENTPQYVDIITDPPRKVQYSLGRIKCKICGAELQRNNQSNHNKSKRHQLYAEMNNKLRKLLLD